MAASWAARAENPPPAAGFDKLFDELRTRSFEKSPDLEIARATRAQKGGAQYSAWARWAPKVDLVVGFRQFKDYSLLQSGALPDIFFAGGAGLSVEKQETTRWSLQASVPLYSRSVHLGTELAAAEKDAADAELRARIAEHDGRLRQTLGRYLLAAYREAASRSALDNARTAARETKLRFELGQKTKIDMLRADSNVAALEVGQTTATEEKTVANDEFLRDSGLESGECEALGLPAQLADEATIERAVLALTAGAEKIPEWIAPLLAEGADKVVEKATASPTYARLEAAEDAGRVRAAQYMVTEWPSLAAAGTFGKEGPTWNEAFSGGNRSYTLGLTLTVPLFSGGSLLSSWRESANARAVTRVQRVKDERSLRNEVRELLVQMQTLSKSLQANRLRVDQGTELVRLSNKSYQLGKTSTWELLDAQNELLNAKADWAESRLKAVVAARRLAAHLGLEAP